MDFIPYKSNETLERKYYQISQELFINAKYKNKLNSDSKILYAFLLDRLSLSQKNHWIDEDNNVYLIFIREKVQEKLKLSDKTVTKSFKILIEVNLVQEKRQGLGKPNLIYVGKINHSDSENLRGINTNNIKTNIINNKSDEELLLIKEKCNLNEFTKEFDKLRKEQNLAGHLRENSIIMCQMIFTSDQEFFDRIEEQETKRYFDECYKFICNYKNLREKILYLL